MSCLGVTEGAPTRGGKGSPVPPQSRAGAASPRDRGQLARETREPEAGTNKRGGELFVIGDTIVGGRVSPFAEGKNAHPTHRRREEKKIVSKISPFSKISPKKIGEILLNGKVSVLMG